MPNAKLLAVSLCLALLLSVNGCGCGFDCGSDNDDGVQVTRFTLGFSDEPVEDLKAVVIQVTAITLQRANTDNVVIESFTIPELGLVEAESFQIDLLDFRGRNQLAVIADRELDPGSYAGISVAIAGTDVNASYVQQSDDTQVPMSVQNGALELPGFTLREATEARTVEFNLALSLRERPASNDYRLSEDGVRVEDTDSAASITGRVDSALFDGETECAAKEDPTRGNRVYLFAGSTLDPENLSDVFRSSSASAIPDNAIAPFSVATPIQNALTGNWEYAFGYLAIGDYTLAFSCDSDNDDAEDYDGITVPLPATQRYEINLSRGERATCDLVPSGSCG